MSLLTREPAVRVGCFAGVLAVMAAWEALAPRRRLATARLPRWASNLGLVVLDTAVVRVVLPLGAVPEGKANPVRYVVGQRAWKTVLSSGE